MKRKKICICLTVLLLITALSTTAFAIDESEVQSAIASSSKAEVAGNIFIWFLCAIGFLKVSQKIDSFMASLGVNVGRTGGSMIGELLIAGRAITAAASALGGGGNIFSRNHGGAAHSSTTNNVSSTTNRAAGSGFAGGHGAIGVAQRAVNRAAAASATGRGSGLGSVIGGALFTSSMARNGSLATSVISTVAQGDISTVGSITGDQAAEALTSYLGYGSAASVGGGDAGASDNAEADNIAPGNQSHPSGGSHGVDTVIAPGGASPVVSSHDGGTSVPVSPTEGATMVTPDGGSAVPVQSEPSFETSPANPVDWVVGSPIPVGQTPGEPIVTEDGAYIPPAPAGESVEHTTIPGGNASYPVGAVPISASQQVNAGGSTGSIPRSDSGAASPASPTSGAAVSQTAPTFRDVEIGGGRITGYESTPGESGERQFAMYNADQYMQPSGDFSVVKTVDGASWYKQYAEPVVKKTPREDSGGKISYEERIVQQLPQIPKRKDRV